MWTMPRAAVTSAALICSFALASSAFAQAKSSAAKKDATPAVAPTAAPSPELMRARMRPPVKGTAYIEFIQGTPKIAGKELVRVTKVKNVSDAPIVGLRLDDYIYKGQEEVGSGTGRFRNPLAPRET